MCCTLDINVSSSLCGETAKAERAKGIESLYKNGKNGNKSLVRFLACSHAEENGYSHNSNANIRMLVSMDNDDGTSFIPRHRGV